MIAGVVVVVACVAAAAPVDDAPAADVRHARGLHQRYTVRDGSLFIAKDGGPDVEFAPDVKGAGDHVVAVFADEDEFFAVVDDKGGLGHFESGVYDTLWGLPTLPFTRAPLSLPFDVAHLRPGRLAYSMRHQNVQHYQDTKGQQFYWGNAGTTTLWALSDDGREILLGDPWLPPDFSRELCGPERSSIVVESVAASASTVFVIAKDGALYTRFVDYDSFGGTPFYDYRYGEFDVEGRAGSDPDSETQPRALPAEEWTPQPAPPATRLSRRIAIRQDGKGNESRTLQLVGDNADGQRGVFHKRLNDAAWTFTAAAIDLAGDDWIDATAAARVPVPQLAYSGFVKGKDGVFGDTSDFWFHCTPFHLTLTFAGDPVDFTVHTVDAWTLFTNVNPRHDPDAYKSLKATVTLTPGQTLSPSTQARVDELFKARLGVSFAFGLVANQHELVLFPVGYPWNAARGAWQLVLRSGRDKVRDVVPLFAAASGGDPCDEAQQKKTASELALARSLEAGLPAGTGVADLLTVLTTTRWTWRTTRWLLGLEQHLPAVLGTQVVARERALAGRAAACRQTQKPQPTQTNTATATAR